MEELIRSWLYSLLISGCICSLILYFQADGKMKTLLETGCACVMSLVFLSPITSFTMREEIDSYFEQWASIEAQTSVNFSSEQSSKSFIEKEYSAYILSEGKRMGISILNAEVKTELDQNGFWIPISVIYQTEETIPNSFKTHIANNLGISEERQHTDETTSNKQ